MRLKKLIKIFFVSVFSILALLIVFGVFKIKSETKQLSGKNTGTIDPSKYEYLEGKIAIISANVLSPDAEKMIPNQTILIEGNTIKEIGDSISIPSDYQRIDAKGEYVIPGLNDTHVHSYQSKNDLLLYLANGITNIAMMNSWKGTYLEWRKEAERENILRPKMYIAAGPLNTRKGTKNRIRSWFEPIPIYNSTSEARKAVKDFKEQGYDALKAYTLQRDIYFAIADEAKKVGIEMVGHLTPYASLDDLYKSGQSQVAHVEELTKAVQREFGGSPYIYFDNIEPYLDFLRGRADSIAIRLKENDIAISTTLVVLSSILQQDVALPDYLKSIELEYVNPGILEGSVFNPGWLPGSNKYENPNNSDTEGIKKAKLYWGTYEEAANIMTRALARNGVLLTSGTDAGNPGIVPGFSLHEELRLLTKIGLSNSEVLRIATQNGSDWMGMNTGKIEKGRIADLVILKGNPLNDINNTKTIQSVMVDGKLLKKVEIQKILQDIIRANNSSRKLSIEKYL